MEARRTVVDRSAQTGVTLLEVVLALGILAFVTVGLNQLSDRFADDTKSTVAAGQVRTFGEAAKSYIKDNYAAVQAVATTTSPALIDVPTLIAAGKLPAGYQNKNAFDQSTCALVLEPTANRLQAMVISEGGTALGDPSLSSVAAVIGGSGGGVYSSDTTQIRGAVGGWAVPVSTFDNRTNNLGKKCDASVGNVRVTAGRPVMALWFENGDTSSAFVARDAVPGRPELNAMNTPLVMNAVQTLNAACSASGAIAQDGSGGIMSCQGGAWKLVGDGKCVATTSDLNALQENGRCYNGIALPNSPAGGEWVFVEVFRHYNNAVYYVTQRIIGMTGAAIGKTWTRSQNSGTAGGGWSAWIQQADPQVSVASGNVVGAGTLQGAYLYSTGNIGAAGSVMSSGNVVAAGTVQGSYVYSTGSVTAGYDLNSYNNVVNQNGSVYNYSNTWSFLGYAPGGAGNAEPTSGRGSAYLNDVYLRSVGKWLSQSMNGISFYSIDVSNGVCPGCQWTVAPNWYVGGTAKFLYGYANTYGGGNCSGLLYARWRDVYGNVIRGYTLIAGTNTYSGNDGGSGMYDTRSFTLPMLNNAYYIDFMAGGCWTAQVYVNGVGTQ